MLPGIERDCQVFYYYLLFIISSRNCNILSKAGWSWGCVSALDREGRTVWIADAHRDDGKHFVVRADDKLTAFVELGVVRGEFDFA